MCRIRRSGQEPIIGVDTVEAIEAAIRSGEPGRWHIDEIRADPLPTGHASRRWGVAIKRPDGTVEIEPDPWDS